jgi:hypothetical protein
MFLDEIGDLDPQVQPKLLKVLEEKRFRRLGEVRDRQVDVQLMAASHQNLPQLVQDRKFRGDLYFRISTIPLRMPPLRERPEDVPILARQLLEGFAGDVGRRGVRLSSEAERALAAYAWPGNVRELRNVLERALLLCAGDVLEPADLRFEGPGAVSPAAYEPAPATESHLTLEELEKVHIERVLREMGGRVAEASQRLGIPRSTLYQKLKKYSIGLPGSWNSPDLRASRWKARALLPAATTVGKLSGWTGGRVKVGTGRALVVRPPTRRSSSTTRRPFDSPSRNTSARAAGRSTLQPRRRRPRPSWPAPSTRW